jgi:hypothetical protein
VVFRNYQDMTGVDRLNIHECQNVFRFIDDADRPFASDQFTENAGFQINWRHFHPIPIRRPPSQYHQHLHLGRRIVQMSALDRADPIFVVIEPRLDAESHAAEHSLGDAGSGEAGHPERIVRVLVENELGTPRWLLAPPS